MLLHITRRKLNLDSNLEWWFNQHDDVVRTRKTFFFDLSYFFNVDFYYSLTLFIDTVIRSHLRKSLKDDISNDDNDVKIKVCFSIVLYLLHISLNMFY